MISSNGIDSSHYVAKVERRTYCHQFRTLNSKRAQLLWVLYPHRSLFDSVDRAQHLDSSLQRDIHAQQ